MASEVGVCPWYLFDTSNMICKGVPLTLLPVCEEQKCFYSTNLTFSIPMEWTTQRYYLFSFYYIQDGSTRQASSLLNVTNPVIQIDQGICHPISLAGDPNLKFDLVFIAENFTDLAPFNDSISSFIGESLFGIDIILNNSGKINFWKLDRYGPLQPPFASDQYPGPAFWEGMVSACGGSDMVVVVDRTIHESPVAFGGDSIPWILVSDSSSQYPSILAHEFGHAFGSLSDEYTRSNIYLPPASIDYTRANIDFMGCPKWCSGQPNTELVLSNGFGCWEGWLEFTACVEMLNLTTDIDPHIEECWNNISDLHNGWFADPTQCDFGTGCIPGTGCFWNAKATNTFRSTDNSIMRSAPPSVGYGPISSQVIISRFNQYR